MDDATSSAKHSVYSFVSTPFTPPLDKRLLRRRPTDASGSSHQLIGVSPGRLQNADDASECDGGIDSVPSERSGLSHGLDVWRIVSRPSSTIWRSGQFLRAHTRERRKAKRALSAL